MAFALAECVLVELMVFVVFQRDIAHRLTLGVPITYATCIFIAIPAIAGLKGYSIVGRLLVASDDASIKIDRISRQFVFGIASAYTTIVLIVELLSRNR